ncbi:hypothetical protein D1970_11355 [Mesobacillus zeae]|uniref:Uncharacterized protein n=1 Tax=Mesobacillus zeae TaxID=1917180 RepID=A0A398BAL7_9BACI|nr:hypothetical protein D1970_11355 [Mesobacillus zeae]
MLVSRTPSERMGFSFLKSNNPEKIMVATKNTGYNKLSLGSETIRNFPTKYKLARKKEARTSFFITAHLFFCFFLIIAQKA